MVELKAKLEEQSNLLEIAAESVAEGTSQIDILKGENDEMSHKISSLEVELDSKTIELSELASRHDDVLAEHEVEFLDCAWMN